jgi:hypothetical protein
MEIDELIQLMKVISNECKLIFTIRPTNTSTSTRTCKGSNGDFEDDMVDTRRNVVVTSVNMNNDNHNNIRSIRIKRKKKDKIKAKQQKIEQQTKSQSLSPSLLNKSIQLAPLTSPSSRSSSPPLSTKLTNYPTLQQAILSKHNHKNQDNNNNNNNNHVFHEFCKLNIFSQSINQICERLRKELQECQKMGYSENGCQKINDICIQHVKLESLLLEAEREMKTSWMMQQKQHTSNNDNNDDNDSASSHSIRTNNTTSTNNTKQSRSRSSRSKTNNINKQHPNHKPTSKSTTTASSSSSTTGTNIIYHEYYNSVDNFLDPCIDIVLKLGRDLQNKMLNDVQSAADDCFINPTGLELLLDSIEIYEHSAMHYQQQLQHNNESHNSATTTTTTTTKTNQFLHFTNIRSKALAQVYTSFEYQSIDVFRTIHMQAADIAEEGNALNSQFDAVIKAATELVTRIHFVQNELSPCLQNKNNHHHRHNWCIEYLWGACVSQVCCNQIIQQIGSSEGQHLPDLSVVQLLDLVAWVEFFRDIIVDVFPKVNTSNNDQNNNSSSSNSSSNKNTNKIQQYHVKKKTHFDDRPIIAFSTSSANKTNNNNGDYDEENMILTLTNVIIWAYNILSDVQRLAQDEFLLRTKTQIDKLLTKIYNAKHDTFQTNKRRLYSSLGEDIFSLVGLHIRTILERLTPKSEELIVMTVCLLFSQLRLKQIKYRGRFSRDLDSCCAASNDFLRMSIQCEDLLHEILEFNNDQNHDNITNTSTNTRTTFVTTITFSHKSLETLKESCDALVTLYSGDAVYSAQKIYYYIFKPIWEEVADDLFSVKWERELTYNELALKITKTLVSTQRLSGNCLEFFNTILHSLIIDIVLIYI